MHEKKQGAGKHGCWIKCFTKWQTGVNHQQRCEKIYDHQRSRRPHECADGEAYGTPELRIYRYPGGDGRHRKTELLQEALEFVHSRSAEHIVLRHVDEKRCRERTDEDCAKVAVIVQPALQTVTIRRYYAVCMWLHRSHMRLQLRVFF